MRRHIVLVGFMASGKSTVGRLLAAEFGLPFVDTDALIVERHGTIAAIFARGGEPAFRAYELAAVETALAGEPAVVALGGGAISYGPTRALVAQRALRIYLDVPAPTLLRRLRRAVEPRPLMGRAPDLASVQSLLTAREPLYREAEITARGGRGSPARFAREVAGLVRAWEAAQ
ncbi:MAG: shikimate kinase [Vulcanimicrobiaceae bacterium]